MKALWFSMFFPTSEQLDEIKSRGYELVEVQAGIKLSGTELANSAAVDAVIRGIVVSADRHRACAVFGVFPVPVLSQMWEFRVGLHLFSAWNAKSDCGAFRHKQWCRIG